MGWEQRPRRSDTREPSWRCRCLGAGGSPPAKQKRTPAGRAEARLLASLAREGQKVPIVVVTEEDGGHEVIDGFRRIRGLMRLKEEIVDAVEWPTDAVDALLELRPVQRRGGSAALVEEGLLIAMWIDRHGLSLADLTIRLQRSRTWIHGRLSLVRQLPETVLRLVLSGELSAYVACKVVVPFARASSLWVEPLCRCVIEHGLTSRQVEALYRELGRIPDPEMRRQVLDRPSRIRDMEATGTTKASRNSTASLDPLDIVDRLKRWSWHTQGLFSMLKRVLAIGASEDTLGRLVATWRSCEGVVRLLVQQLQDLMSTEQRLDLHPFQRRVHELVAVGTERVDLMPVLAERSQVAEDGGAVHGHGHHAAITIYLSNAFQVPAKT
ncbi:MAG: ParB N-terminal domain-containing protein [Candidatus Riflebacteria bacterium]|nr:ParB N-terminal domain-containing protein [Candidatus Riflebacteria bacterium]